MRKKRSQRKNSNYNYRPGQKAGEDPQALQENSRTKKFSPAARNLLFVGLILLLGAVGIQFQFWRGPKSKIPKGPRS